MSMQPTASQHVVCPKHNDMSYHCIMSVWLIRKNYREDECFTASPMVFAFNQTCTEHKTACILHRVIRLSNRWNAAIYSSIKPSGTKTKHIEWKRDFLKSYRENNSVSSTAVEREVSFFDKTLPLNTKQYKGVWAALSSNGPTSLAE